MRKLLRLAGWWARIGFAGFLVLLAFCYRDREYLRGLEEHVTSLQNEWTSYD